LALNNFRAGLVFSTVFHAGIVYVAVVGLPELRRAPPEPEKIIPIGFVEIDELDRPIIREIAKPVEEKQPEARPEEPKVAEAEPVKAIDANAVPLPEKVRPKPKPKKAIPKPKRRASPRITPRMKPKPPSTLSASRMAALIDRSKKKTFDAIVKPKAEPKKKEKAPEKVSPVMTSMERRKATATITTALQQMVGECWNPPTGAQNAEDLRVRVRILFNVDGELARPPEIMDKGRMNSNSFYRVAAESAARAIRRCAPYELPKDKFDLWKEIDFMFDPSEMLGN
jgi:hypothetical protein